MIIGLGSDLCDVRRIEDALARFDARFPHRLFTDVERAYCDAKASRASAYAKRFAAKEACAKALGTGIRDKVSWRDMGVVNSRHGRPSFELTGGAAERLADITPPGMRAVVHLTLTDEEPYAFALVLIEALPC